MNQSKKLNLGCGSKKMAGYLNVDDNSNCHPDIVYDLNNLPYPFDDNQFSEIYLEHVLEHLDDPISIILELYRISVDGGILIIKCPHFSCNWFHPGHKRGISTRLFDFFKKENSERYGNAEFEVQAVKLKWMRYLSGKRGNFIIRFLDRLINFLANLSPAVAERMWCYWVGGFEEVYFKVKVNKDVARS